MSASKISKAELACNLALTLVAMTQTTAEVEKYYEPFGVSTRISRKTLRSIQKLLSKEKTIAALTVSAYFFYEALKAAGIFEKILEHFRNPREILVEKETLFEQLVEIIKNGSESIKKRFRALIAWLRSMGISEYLIALLLFGIILHFAAPIALTLLFRLIKWLHYFFFEQLDNNRLPYFHELNPRIISLRRIEGKLFHILTELKRTKTPVVLYFHREKAILTGKRILDLIDKHIPNDMSPFIYEKLMKLFKDYTSRVDVLKEAIRAHHGGGLWGL